MILVDTNVVPEPLRRVPELRGADWIAATANAMMVATRDTAPFEAAGLKTVDPSTV